MSKGSKIDILEPRIGERRELKERRPQEEWVPVEVIRRILVNDTEIATLVASPGYERELALGFCFSEGVLRTEDIREISVRGSEIRVEIEGSLKDFERILDSSGCIGTRSAEIPKVDFDLRIELEKILRAIKEINSEEYKKSKGVHTACFFDSSGELTKRISDVGKSNALDKLIGWCLLNGVELTEGFLVTSGRHSIGTTSKIARAGIPVAVSKASALSMAIEIAEICGITLCAFADERKVLVYTHPRRII